jgi:hypothetical protein
VRGGRYYRSARLDAAGFKRMFLADEPDEDGLVPGQVVLHDGMAELLADEAAAMGGSVEDAILARLRACMEGR